MATKKLRAAFFGRFYADNIALLLCMCVYRDVHICSQMDDYYSNNAEFLDRMRHVSCFEHVQRVKGFVAEFLGNGSQNPEEASATVRDFVEVGIRSCVVT